MKTAIVHYWLVGMRGGEKVVEALCELYPDADIFTHVYEPDGISNTIKSHSIKTSFIQRLPFARKHYKKYLVLMPFAAEALDLQNYDLIISSEAGPIKGVITRPDALHICYCHSPMRYIWDQYHEYRRNSGKLVRIMMGIFATPLRLWDTTSSVRVDHFIANSKFVAGRIRKYYGRDATVINPPVSVEKFHIAAEIDDYYLCFGQLVFYKRFDLAVDAFNQSGRRLIIVGQGEEYEALRKKANPNIQFMGRVSDDEIRGLLAKCRALIFPGLEDFGIVPLEAAASGRPVIAYGAGGALETIIDGETGLLFNTQTIESLNAAVAKFESGDIIFNPTTLKIHAANFSKEIFKEKISNFINSRLPKKNLNSVQLGLVVNS